MTSSFKVLKLWVSFLTRHLVGLSLKNELFSWHVAVCLFLVRQPPPPPSGPGASSFTRFLEHTQRRTTADRNPLDKWSARRRDLYTLHHTTLTTNIHALGGIRTHNPSKRAAADPHLRPRGHWDRLMCSCRITKCLHKCANLDLAVYVDTEHLTVDSSFNSPVREVL